MPPSTRRGGGNRGESTKPRQPRRELAERAAKLATSSNPPKRKTGKKTTDKREEPEGEIRPIPSDHPSTTDPKLILCPVLSAIDPALTDAWALNVRKRSMHTIFDLVDPVRHFKRGTHYDERDPDCFPLYNPSPDQDPNVVEVDDPHTPLQPYLPQPYR